MEIREGTEMKMPQIREISKEKGVKAGKMSKAALIRAIQKTEGNNDCFGENVSKCGQMNCLWREDCVAAAAL